MAKISAGAGLGIKLTIGAYQNIDPSFWVSWEEEVEDGLSDEDKLKRTKEIIDICRQECEDRIDEDIEKITETKIFSKLPKRSK